jgi:hypothetical protein
LVRSDPATKHRWGGGPRAHGVAVVRMASLFRSRVLVARSCLWFEGGAGAGGGEGGAVEGEQGDPPGPAARPACAGATGPLPWAPGRRCCRLPGAAPAAVAVYVFVRGWSERSGGCGCGWVGAVYVWGVGGGDGVRSGGLQDVPMRWPPPSLLHSPPPPPPPPPHTHTTERLLPLPAPASGQRWALRARARAGPRDAPPPPPSRPPLAAEPPPRLGPPLQGPP